MRCGVPKTEMFENFTVTTSPANTGSHSVTVMTDPSTTTSGAYLPPPGVDDRHGEKRGGPGRRLGQRLVIGQRQRRFIHDRRL